MASSPRDLSLSKTCIHIIRHETIDVLDGGGDVTLAHAPSVQGEDLAFDGGGIALVLLDDLRLEGASAVTGHADGDFSQGRLASFFGVSVAGIAIGIRAFMACMAEMALHLSFECRFEDRREDALDGIIIYFAILSAGAGLNVRSKFLPSLFSTFIVENRKHTETEMFEVAEAKAGALQCLDNIVASFRKAVVIARLDSVPYFFMPFLRCFQNGLEGLQGGFFDILGKGLQAC